MKKAREMVTVMVPVVIEYENRKGAREAVIDRITRNGPTNSNGYSGNFGGYSTKVLPIERVVPFGQS